MISLYTNDELTNEQYRELPQISGSEIVKVWHECPAKYKYSEPKTSGALEFGIAAHVMMLEQEKFDGLYFRDLDPADHPNMMHTAKDMQAFLKERGVKGGSGKSVEELQNMVIDHEGSDQIFALVRSAHIEASAGTPLAAKDYDKIHAMREALHADESCSQIIKCIKYAEISIVDDGMNRKCRIDSVVDRGNGPEIWDYKTTRSVHPEKFGKSAYDLGYWLKMALQADLFQAFYGEAPTKVGFVAQEKEAPYLCKAYTLTDEQLQAGREEYQRIAGIMDKCQETGVWPTYDGGEEQLYTPPWVANMYGFEDDSVEIEILE